jgi:hypothetical protein
MRPAVIGRGAVEARLGGGRSRSSIGIGPGTRGQDEERSPCGCERKGKLVRSSKTLPFKRPWLPAGLLQGNPRSDAGQNAERAVTRSRPSDRPLHRVRARLDIRCVHVELRVLMRRQSCPRTLLRGIRRQFDRPDDRWIIILRLC